MLTSTLHTSLTLKSISSCTLKGHHLLLTDANFARQGALTCPRSLGTLLVAILRQPLVIMGPNSASKVQDAPLPDPNRHITDNDAEGKSFFSAALPTAVPVAKDLGGALQRFAYTTPRGPGLLTEQADLKTYQFSLQNLPPLVPPGGGAVVWYIDTPPDSASPLHRTVSLDLVIQVAGEIELTLESGETRIMKPGDMTVQRSTLHAWRNKSTTKWSRMVAVMTECQPVQVGEKTLGTEFLKH